jgi:penicillin-binding protein 2
MIIQEKALYWPGVEVEIVPVRDYPTGVLTASMIGFLGPIPANRAEEFTAAGLDQNRDKVGYAGVELQFQDLLAGKNGLRIAEVDVAGKELRTVGEIQSPVSGLNLRMTIDTRLQAAATAIVQRRLISGTPILMKFAPPAA